MNGTFNANSLHKIDYDCSGSMPWLGEDDHESGHCGQHLRVVQRGGSNVYFPVTASSIHLPLWGQDTSRAINRILDDPANWDVLTAGLDDGKYIQRVRCDVLAATHKVDTTDLLEAAQSKLDGTVKLTDKDYSSESGFRQQEYEALRSGQGDEASDLVVETKDAIEYGSELSSALKGIGLVRKLRETRAMVGFSRILPVEDPASPDLLPISQSESLDWLPATEVYGEGIFLEFNDAAIAAWSTRLDVKSRISSHAESFNRRRRIRGMSDSIMSEKYVLLHTISHALIAQLSFDCGYGSAALRERLYCDADDSDYPMQGLLIYTASGDSEGTLGGLVRQGEPDRLTGVFGRAIDRLRWCSSDPVCIESLGQGTDNANLAACHGCVLLPETSCETGNRLLDRGLLIGTTDLPEIAFFPDTKPIDL